MGGPLRSRGFATLDAGQSRRRSGCGDESSERFQATCRPFSRLRWDLSDGFELAARRLRSRTTDREELPGALEEWRRHPLRHLDPALLLP
ncbi:unnamed protein product [Cladocopium goreaui]|uniref:Uncharacterized protein n=1 Tax=Cladocopium goreaui TaxID=2562237 RepID=A0A9P1FKN1_9DINO|nr:unnamed protein product [Cladocopium goreaui]